MWFLLSFFNYSRHAAKRNLILEDAKLKQRKENDLARIFSVYFKFRIFSMYAKLKFRATYNLTDEICQRL